MRDSTPSDCTEFKTIAIVGRPHIPEMAQTLASLIQYLESRHISILLEKQTAQVLPKTHLKKISAAQFQNHPIDLIIVVGGDGSLLNAAHIAVEINCPVLGINRGRLGFLADIHPQQLDKIGDVFNNQYIEEHRFLLNIEIQPPQGHTQQMIALNDCVLSPGDLGQMIKFDISINEQFVYSHRADGMIIATPTGSTAYALSGGGPIMHPSINACVLVPMFPHTLSSRPIVVDGHSHIVLHIDERNECEPMLSTDGQKRIPIPIGTYIHIRRKQEELRLIHPTDYNYYTTLREKLGWEKTAERTSH